MPLSEDWPDQYRRMLRSRARLGQAAGPSASGSDEARDALYHFFQDAFHLRDWLRYSSDSTASAAAAELIDRNDLAVYPALAKARDLAVGAKHLDLASPSVTGKPTELTSQSVSIAMPPLTLGVEFPGSVASTPAAQSTPSATHSWTVTFDGHSDDALELADKIIETWDSWLKAKRLAP